MTGTCEPLIITLVFLFFNRLRQVQQKSNQVKKKGRMFKDIVGVIEMLENSYQNVLYVTSLFIPTQIQTKQRTISQSKMETRILGLIAY
jgi:hypothetical protein